MLVVFVLWKNKTIYRCYIYNIQKCFNLTKKCVECFQLVINYQHNISIEAFRNIINAILCRNILWCANQKFYAHGFIFRTEFYMCKLDGSMSVIGKLPCYSDGLNDIFENNVQKLHEGLSLKVTTT